MGSGVTNALTSEDIHLPFTGPLQLPRLTEKPPRLTDKHFNFVLDSNSRP